MSEWIANAALHLQELPPAMVYLGLFLASLIENVFPPIPGDTVTVFGAYLIGIGVIEFWKGWIVANIGSVAGFYGMFLAGRYLGRKTTQHGGFRFFPKQYLDKVSRWFDRYGYGVVAANRFLSGARSVISLSAGMARMKHLPVIFLSLLSSMTWNGALMYAGMKLGKNWERVIDYIGKYNQAVFIAMAVVVTAYLAWRVLKNRKRI